MFLVGNMTKILGVIVFGLFLSGCNDFRLINGPSVSGTLSSFNISVDTGNSWDTNYILCEARINAKNLSTSNKDLLLKVYAFDSSSKKIDQTNFYLYDIPPGNNVKEVAHFKKKYICGKVSSIKLDLIEK